MSKRAELRLCYELHLISYALFLYHSSLRAKSSLYHLKFRPRKKLTFGYFESKLNFGCREHRAFKFIHFYFKLF